MGEGKPDNQAGQRPQVPPPVPSVEPPKTSRMAVAAFILAILPTCITQLVAIVLGVMSIIQISHSKGRLKGSGFAIAAVIIAPLLLFIALPAALLLPALSAAREKARRSACSNNLRQVGIALESYMADYSGYFPYNGKPDSAATLDILRTGGYIGTVSVFRCPSSNVQPTEPLTDGGCSYAYFNTFKTQKTAYNICGTDAILAYDKDGNHKDGRNVLFLDDSVRWISEDGFQRMLREQQEKMASPTNAGGLYNFNR